jgi:hypothetical protein
MTKFKIDTSSVKIQLDNTISTVIESGKLIGKEVKPCIPLVLGMATLICVHNRMYRGISLAACHPNLSLYGEEELLGRVKLVPHQISLEE